MYSDERRLDGNAVGGELAAYFNGIDMTAALRRCSECLQTATLAEHIAYVDAPGIVLRCPECDAVGMTLAGSAGHRVLWLDGPLHMPWLH